MNWNDIGKITIFDDCINDDPEGLLKRLSEDRNINVDAISIWGDRAIHLAARCSFQCLKILLEHGANVHSRDRSGNTPLHIATIYSETLDSIKILLDHGADIDAIDNYGETPLYNVSSEKMIRFLLENGADPDIRNERGKLFTDYICDHSLRNEIKEYIQTIKDMNIKEPCE